MTPLPIDERRVGRLSQACEAIDEEQPRQWMWKARRAEAYRRLAEACELAAKNARASVAKAEG